VPPGVDVRAVAQGVNALARFEHHALSQLGITHIIVLEGINDIGIARQNPTPTAEDLIAGHKQLIEQAHTRGLKILGATLTPFYGAASTSIQAMPRTRRWPTPSTSPYSSNKDRKRALLQHGAKVAIWPMSAAGRTPYYDIDYPSLTSSQPI
jgi:hypothetical protein